MRLILHTLRVVAYICALICLFNGATIVGYDGGEVVKFFIDFGMAAGLRPRRTRIFVYSALRYKKAERQRQ